MCEVRSLDVRILVGKSAKLVGDSALVETIRNLLFCRDFCEAVGDSANHLPTQLVYGDMGMC